MADAMPPSADDLLGQMLQTTQQAAAPGQSVGISMSVPQSAEPSADTQASQARIREDAQRLRESEVSPADTAESFDEQRQNILNRYRSATAQPLADIHQITEERLKPLEAEAAKAEAEYQDAVKQRQAYRAKVESVVNDMDTMSKRIAAEQPHDIWAESGLGVKIAGIALMGLGAAAQSMYGDKTNVVTDQIDAAIRRDLAIQKMRLEKNQNDFSNKNLLINQFRANVDHMQNAEDAAHAAAWQGILGRLNIVKSMLQDPTARMNVEKVIAEGQLKSVESQQRLMSDLLGKDARMKEGEGLLEEKAAKLGASRDSALRLNAETRAAAERRLEGKREEEKKQLEIPGWEFPQGFKGAPKEATALRDMETDTFKATAALDQVRDMLTKGGQFTSYPKWADIAAATNRAIVKLKGKGLVNAGANFTKLEEDLIRKGYLSSSGEWLRNLDPTAAARIKAAEADLWDDVEAAFHERGGRPTKEHQIFGGQ